MVTYINKNTHAIYAGNAGEAPMDVQNGSVFHEMDTGLYYMYDAENREWLVQEDNGGGGTGGTTDHTQLTNRDKPDQHPIEAISGLREELDGKADEIDIPTKLPSPNDLTFTGAVSAIYNGSAPVTIDIPQVSGGDVYPQDNPAMTHNLPRGKNLGTSVTAEQYANITNGSFKDMYVGDYWTIGGRDYVIAGINYYKNCGDVNTTQNHLVMIPRRSMYYAQMHNTASGEYEEGPEANTTEGAYALSDMRTTNLEQARTTINAAFPGHVITHRIYLENAVSGGRPSNGAWFDSDVDLMNEQMVYGGPIWQNMLSAGNGFPKYRVEKSQLPVFAYAPELVNIRESYWLRDVATASNFARAGTIGYADSGNASTAGGVRPAFIIG